MQAEILPATSTKTYRPCNNCDRCLSTEVEETFDGTRIAQITLSAVCTAEGEIRNWRIIDFLKRFQFVKLWEEHRYLPTFGKGEHTRDEWRSYPERFEVRQDS